MSTRSEQPLKRWPTDGHLEGLKVRRKQKTLERRKSNALRRQKIKECKKLFSLGSQKNLIMASSNTLKENKQ